MENIQFVTCSVCMKEESTLNIRSDLLTHLLLCLVFSLLQSIVLYDSFYFVPLLYLTVPTLEPVPSEETFLW